MKRIPRAVWRAQQQAHEALVDTLTQGQRDRSRAGKSHPVEDFLFTYYALRPAQLRVWHPGAGVALIDADEYDAKRFYTTRIVDGVSLTWVNTAEIATARSGLVALIAGLLPATAEAPAQFGCFGLHEWAMVHRQTDADRRHETWPLRLSAAETDAVVESHQIKCSHYDAFRFFTPSSRRLNLLQPTVESREQLEQPGCLHATMDLYKWAYKLSPAVQSDLLIECFLLARRVREWDMRASPYDLSSLGYEPVAIETAEGKAAYVAMQREFAELGQVLRRRLIQALTEAGLIPVP
ncbi:3-methyladenine DNA glycosylase [Nakamurella antarctica]|uniref:3-methyladenine DNA glycosylase n=1 Tax=Nakamurella antarctica TaxID=1902245 RepID=A0A3G8ZQM9_9ACTN|nr:3-methyladenine DNA glycosylase [Nakamurella antarctica]